MNHQTITAGGGIVPQGASPLIVAAALALRERGSGSHSSRASDDPTPGAQ